MSKGLEALENIKHYDSRVGLHEGDYQIIEKSLKALEIIKEKPQTLFLVKTCEKYDKYLEIAQDQALIEDLYTQEEYDLLKEVLL